MAELHKVSKRSLRKKQPEGPSVNRFLRNPWWAEVIIYTIVFLLGAITLLPMINVLARSFSPPHVLAKIPFMLIPSEPTLEAYKYIFKTASLMKAFSVSVYVTIVGTIGSLFVTITAAYGLSKTFVPGNKWLMRFFVLAMLFGAGLIPSYIVVHNLLHLDDTYAVLVLPFLASPFNIILLRNFFWSIPGELEESMSLDGASYIQMLWHLILPLSKAAISTIGLFYAVGHWNDFYRGLIYIRDSSKWPLPVLMRAIVITNQFTGMGSFSTSELKRQINPDNIKCATIIFSIVPILCVYPFIQNQFTKGVMIGAIKG